MAAAMKLTCLIIILLCSCSLWHSSAQPLQGTSLSLQGGNATPELATISKTQKGLMESTARKATTYYKIEGRKMALHKVMRLAKVKPQSVSASSNQVEGKFDSRQKMTHEGQKVNSKQTTAAHFSAKIDETAGFVAFNADYCAPRHHPPKNN